MEARDHDIKQKTICQIDPVMTRRCVLGLLDEENRGGALLGG